MLSQWSKKEFLKEFLNFYQEKGIYNTQINNETNLESILSNIKLARDEFILIKNAHNYKRNTYLDEFSYLDIEISEKDSPTNSQQGKIKKVITYKVDELPYFVHLQLFETPYNFNYFKDQLLRKLFEFPEKELIELDHADVNEESFKTLKKELLENLVSISDIFERYNKVLPLLNNIINEFGYPLNEDIIQMSKSLEDKIWKS